MPRCVQPYTCASRRCIESLASRPIVCATMPREEHTFPDQLIPRQTLLIRSIYMASL
jgi:hypothetical protein